jgi:agmatinase
MVHLFHSNANEMSDADIVIIGVDDESKSHARRKGASKGPDIIRIVSNESNFFERNGKIIPICPMKGSIADKKIFDNGNIKREDIYQLIFNLVSSNKIPIIIGGDHSITTNALNAIGDYFGRVGLLYFDAHPDFVSSTTDYYGSVITDSYKYIDIEKSLMLGIRSAELEELNNARKVGMDIITPIDIIERGILNIADTIKSKNNGGKRYISIDLDCLDPAFAPGVSVPSPHGLSSMDLIYLTKTAISTGIVAIDIVEYTPDFDVNNITASLAARILLESLASINISK